MSFPLRRPAGTCALLLVLLAGCSSGTSGLAKEDPSGAEKGRSTSGTAKVRPPRADAVFDYQLGGAYAPPAGVRAVSRDRTAKPADGLYNICYVNAFQAQPGDAVDWWHDKHPRLLLRGADGEPVIDGDWEEPLLDISTDDKRAALLGIVGPWIDACADAGFDAVEPDNLDSYERSDGLLTADDAAAFAGLLARRAHQQGLAIAQKNTTDLLGRRRLIGFDFAVVEECARYQECPDFVSAYDGRVFDIEYEEKDFTAACRAWSEELSITLRDRDVRPVDADGHVYEHC
ncbi:endo alpha-1,4 polygalactosaminidase [Streptomyces sp. AK02-01A]|uniref:endo alpha-1,4 polygalactosaminidase n=1 Tax=Streptomyces sp. AK02-01A TaxID=3028648 RepID=UPI0029A82C63|nr:endo alpha-1,4 polygalactosaminidase [Streptomyces sp. AK02-01A]MDX3850203.1 endo alpha-1,4 polygalactosaminidase [Streptomyces sp. AK02-01A]